jgi:hypothetical protein
LFTNNEKNKLNYQSDIYKLTQTHQLRGVRREGALFPDSASVTGEVDDEGAAGGVASGSQPALEGERLMKDVCHQVSLLRASKAADSYDGVPLERA